MSDKVIPNITWKFNPAGGCAVFTGTEVNVDTLFDYILNDRTLSDFLTDSPEVERKDVVSLLNEAAARFDDDVTYIECERRAQEMKDHPERGIPAEEVFAKLREHLELLKERDGK